MKEHPGVHWIGDWVGPRAALDEVEKIFVLTRSRSPAPRSVASGYTDCAILALLILKKIVYENVD
jgi:hypothetical protein